MVTHGYSGLFMVIHVMAMAMAWVKGQWLIVRDSLQCNSMGSVVYEMTGSH